MDDELDDDVVADDAPLAPLTAFKFLMTADAGAMRALRDSRIFPLTGSRPKYLTGISWPTSIFRALG